MYIQGEFMKRAKVFKSGNSQAVRLPKEFAFKGKEVEILQRDKELILREIPQNLGKAFKLLTQLPKDCFTGKRKDTKPQKRETF